MKKITLHIENFYDNRTVSLDDEITIGRTNLSQIVLDDPGLSRKNTTFFRDGDDVFVVDENSLNGTFVNGQRVSGGPQPVFDGDLVTIGSGTRISVQIAAALDRSAAASAGATGTTEPQPKTHGTNPKSETLNPKSTKPPLLLLLAAGSTFAIVFLALIGLLLAGGLSSSSTRTTPTPQIVRTAVIPVRVIDPLGGEDPDDLDDLIASWEVEEEELKVETVADVKVSTDSATNEEAELNVTAAFLAEQKKKAMEPRKRETGIRPAGLDVPKELFGDGVIKQKAKLAQMKTVGYQQPLDFADLAQKRLTRELIEMPMATKSYYLEVGGSASEGPFTAFSFQSGNSPIVPGSPKYLPLKQLADNFAGQKYNLENPNDRKQIRMRLLRMFNQRAKPILEELAEAYYQEFKRPLRVTSLTRSMDYQILLNSNNPNSFKVRGEGSLPPHTSGCAFDLARKHMGVDEQNFLMKKLAQMEQEQKLDALIEYGANACFHVFIYFDGIPPKF